MDFPARPAEEAHTLFTLAPEPPPLAMPQQQAAGSPPQQATAWNRSQPRAVQAAAARALGPPLPGQQPQQQLQQRGGAGGLPDLSALEGVSDADRAAIQARVLRLAACYAE